MTDQNEMTDRNEATHQSEAMADAKFSEALVLHRQSRLDEAASAYRQVLKWRPRHVQALTFLGVIAFQFNEFERTLELTERALGVDPNGAGTYLMKGHALVQLGRSEAAVASYDRAIALKPDLTDAYLQRGNVQNQLGRHLEALSSYDKALELEPSQMEIYNNRGNALRALRRYDAAIASYERAIAAFPDLAEPVFNRGLALYDLKRYEAALVSYDQAIAINPGYAEAHCSRGNVLKDLRRPGEALASYDQAIAIKSDYALAYSNRGNLLSELERFEAASQSYDSAIAAAPDNAEAYCNRANLLGDLGRHAEALKSLDRAIAIDPQHAQARFSRSFVYLVLGDFENGWRDFEWRWKNEHCITSKEKRQFPQPLWLGEEFLGGKTILVHCEQGLGDTIQFCRYVNRVAESGATVIFEVPECLHRLMRSLQGAAKLVLQGARLPPFDYHCPLMSLPMALKTTLNTVPSEVPYLQASGERVRYWRDKLGARTKPRVGLVWSGGFRPDQPELWSVNNRRNIPLGRLAALKHPDLEFHSLQKGQPAQSELASSTATHWEGPALIDYTHELHDFEETAALIEQLDLIISVDTSTAHLAAALAKPVWIMNRFDTCWRWLLDRTDSPWYPTVRLYRQERPGDWEEVVQRIRRDLEYFAAAVAAAVPTAAVQ